MDRESLGAELDRRAAGREEPLDVLIQVNVTRTPQQGGADPEALPSLLRASASWPKLRVVGLMTIARPTPDPETARPDFAGLRALLHTLRTGPGGEALRALSMGMSQDFEVAIEEGATIVRVGTAIFGGRPRKGEG